MGGFGPWELVVVLLLLLIIGLPVLVILFILNKMKAKDNPQGKNNANDDSARE